MIYEFVSYNIATFFSLNSFDLTFLLRVSENDLSRKSGTRASKATDDVFFFFFLTIGNHQKA